MAFQTEMDSFDPIGLQSTMLDPSLGPQTDMAVYPDALPLDMASMQSTAFDGVAPGLPNLIKNVPGKTDSSENVPVHAAGAGPLPASFAATSQGFSSTVTEFTKRRNWSQRVLEEIKDLLYILSADGQLLYVSPSSKALTGYEPADLLGKRIFDFVHPDDSTLFMREFNESIATGHALRLYHRFRTAEAKYCIFECHGHPHLTPDTTRLDLSGSYVASAGVCRGFFMMARPYPTRNSELLDSFLEHKIENVRLQARIAALKREEAEDADVQQEHYHKQARATISRTTSSSADFPPASPSIHSKVEYTDYGGMPPPAKPTMSNVALTREALDEANAFARPDSIRDKMARYEGSSHVDSIEMLTGLRYREGERSHGISTGGKSPALIRGDVGIDISIDKTDPRYSYSDKKHKKVKSADEYVCTDCGTLDSPEWRKGPNGPKTLCNACGLRWAKKEKRKIGSTGSQALSTTANLSPGRNAAESTTPAVIKASDSSKST